MRSWVFSFAVKQFVRAVPDCSSNFSHLEITVTLPVPCLIATAFPPAHGQVFMGYKMNMSYYTDSAMLQTMMEIPLEKKAGRLYAPPGKLQMIYFIDDLNMPALDKYNTQSAIELIKQKQDYSHWYDRAKIQVKVRGLGGLLIDNLDYLIESSQAQSYPKFVYNFCRPLLYYSFQNFPMRTEFEGIWVALGPIYSKTLVHSCVRTLAVPSICAVWIRQRDPLRSMSVSKDTSGPVLCSFQSSMLWTWLGPKMIYIWITWCKLRFVHVCMTRLIPRLNWNWWNRKTDFQQALKTIKGFCIKRV